MNHSIRNQCFCWLLLLAFRVPLWSQASADAIIERTYSYSLDEVQSALQQIGGFGGGRLPIVDGFVTVSRTDIDRYQLPYYQYRVQLKAVDSTHTTVGVEAKISALRADADPARSQYESLTSNGRLESDLHDRLQVALRSAQSLTSRAAKSNSPPALPPAPAIAKAPSLTQEQLDAILAERQSIRERAASLEAEIERWKAADHNPSNSSKLASVKRSGVGVMSRQNFGGPVLFRAQADDEFEVVQLESGWAQVRLSSDSTGYIQAEELNLPSGVVTKSAAAASSADAAPSPAAPDLGFSVSREDVTVFSGDWGRLKGKKVLFVYAQPRGLLSDMASEDAKLRYAERIFQSRFRTVSESKTDVEGVVVVFLGTRGGVAAATLADIRQWVEGGLGHEAFVNRCSLDPIGEFRSLRLN
jgi:hypothetical protein